MTVSTPAFAGDLIARIATLNPGPGDWLLSGIGRNLWAHPERPAGGDIGHEALFVDPSGGARFNLHGDGQWREHDAQLLYRYPLADYGTEEEAATAAWARMSRLFDVLHLSGDFVGAVSSAAYQDIRAIDAARLLPNHYCVLNVTAWYDS